MSDERSTAIERLKAKQGFWSNLLAYVVINAVLVIIWALSGAGYFWPIWVIAGWGIGVIFHAWAVFGAKPLSEARIQREIDRQKPTT